MLSDKMQQFCRWCIYQFFAGETNDIGINAETCRKCRTPETSIEAESCISGEPELDSIANIEFVVDDVNDAKYNNTKDAIIAFLF